MRLIEAGYLPKELPVEFTSVPVAATYRAVQTPALLVKRWTQLEPFSLARSGPARRMLGIPNPIYYVRQACTIANHWPKIRRACSSSAISISRPLFRPQGRSYHRATNLNPVQDLSETRLWHLAGKQYVLQTDFARFFSSIYTHAICWALHSKKRCKGLATRRGLLGDDLDNSIRSAQDGQTIGIPVGPDTSHIFSEIIASAIDDAAFGRNWPAGYRYVDDYFLCFDTQQAAFSALDRLVRAASEFEIELNYAKTSVKSISEITDAIGLDELRDFDFGDTRTVGAKSLHKFFSIATALSQTQENSLKYALRILASKQIADADWNVFESYLLRSASLSPNALEYVSYSLYKHYRRAAPINRDRLIAFLSATIVRSLEYGQHSDVAWSLWVFKTLGLRVPAAITSRLSDTSNSVIALLCLDLREQGCLQGTLDVIAWTRLISADALYGEHWLLTYEAVHKGWLKPRSSILRNDAVFSIMHNNDVHFYDANRLADVEAQWAATSDRRTLANIGPLKWFLPDPEHDDDDDLEWYY
jgi:hypothetical protein